MVHVSSAQGKSSMPLLYITEDEVSRLLDMPMAVDAVEGAFRALAEGKAHNVPRVRAKGQGIVLHSMCAAADYLGLVGWKQYTTTRQGACFHVGLYDQLSGELVALVEADRLGQLRTGAVTGAAAKLLARQASDEVGLIGCGWQAESQLAAVATTMKLKRAFCHSRNKEHREKFAEKMSDSLKLEVIPTESAKETVQSKPIVITATTSREPVFDGNWLDPSTLICAIGSNWLNKAEIDSTTIRRAGAIVCDSVEACRNEAGDFVASIEQGEFQWEEAMELADVVGEKSLPRSSDDDIVIFKSVGLAIEDVALAAKLLEIRN